MYQTFCFWHLIGMFRHDLQIQCGEREFHQSVDFYFFNFIDGYCIFLACTTEWMVIGLHVTNVCFSKN